MAKKPLDIFALNDDVWRKIFSYCTVPDLIALAASSDELKAVILANGVRGQLFDFGALGECYHILNIFEMFGKQITKIKFGEKDVQYKNATSSKLDEILRLISTYCSVDTLKYLDLQYFYGTSIKKRNLFGALPFFTCLESLSVTETSTNGSHVCADYFDINAAFNPFINCFVERVVGNAKNITALKLVRLKVTGRFFYADHIQNLRSLAIISCDLRVPAGFISYLESAPKLVSFEWECSSMLGYDTPSSHSSNIVFELITKFVLNLETFRYSENEYYVTERYKLDYVEFFTFPNHERIRSLLKLKALELHTASVDCLKMLAEINVLEKLDANVPFGPTINFDFMQSFTNLKAVKFHTHKHGLQNHLDYLSSLPQLTECHITVSFYFKAIDDVLVKAVETAADLSVLSIWPSFNEFKYNWYRRLYSKLLNVRLDRAAGKPLTFFLKKEHADRFITRSKQSYRPEIIEIQSIRDDDYNY